MSTLSITNIKNRLSQTNAIEIDSNNNVVFRADMTILGTATIGNMSIGQDFTVGDQLTVNGNAVLGNALSDTVTIAGAASVASNFSYNGTLTGGTSIVNIGSGQIYKSALGVVGLGTISPVGTGLHIFRGTSGTTPLVDVDNLVIENSGTCGISILTATGLGRIIFGDTTDSTSAGITYSSITNTTTVGSLRSGGQLVLNSDNGVERVRVDASGNVGVGTSAPVSRLSISNPSGTDGLSVLRGADYTSAAFRVSIDSTRPRLYGYGEGLTFWTGAVGSESERMRIDSTGNVGIGTVAPSEQLHQVGAVGPVHLLENTDTTLSLGQTIGEIRWEQNDVSAGGTGVVGRIMAISENRPDTGTFFGNSARLGIYVAGNSSGDASQNAPYEALTIRSNGNIGIGTTEPARLLHIQGTVPAIRLFDTDVSVSDEILHTAEALQISVDRDNIQANSFLQIAIDSIERARFTALGNLLVGTSVEFDHSRLQVRRDRLATTFDPLANTLISDGNAELAGVYISNEAAQYVGQETGIVLSCGASAAGQTGIYNQRTGTNTADMIFRRRIASGLDCRETARLTSDGNFLVGTSSENGIAGPGIIVASGGNGAQQIVQRDLQIPGENSIGAFAFRARYDATNYAVGASISAIGAGTAWSATNAPTNMIFNVTPAGSITPLEKARLTSAGYLKVSNTGTYGNAAGLVDQKNGVTHYFGQSGNLPGVISLVDNTGSNSRSFESHMPTGAAGFHYQGRINNVVVYQVLANGNVQNTNNSYGALSDAKLKENVVDVSPLLSEFMQVRFRNFNFIGSDLKQFGVIAQELETVFPGLVDETPDLDENGNELGTVTKSVKYSVLALMAGKVIQEQQEIIEKQQATINDILARLSALEAK